MEDQVRKLRAEGKSLRQIAASLNVSKSTVQRITKSWLNPRWYSTQGQDMRPVDAFGAMEAPTSGVLLSLYTDTSYSCSKWLSDVVSAVPLKCYVTTHAGQRKPKCLTAPVVTKGTSLDHLGNYDVREVLDHSFKDLLDQPNCDMNKGELLKLIDVDLSLTGNSFVRKCREGDPHDWNNVHGLPVALWPLEPQFIELAYDEHGRHFGFKETKGATVRFIPKKNVIWFKFFDPENRYGMGKGPTRAAYERIMLSRFELAYLSALYRNQARPDYVIKIKGIVASEAELMQKQLSQRFRQGGIGGPFVVDGDEMEVAPLGWNPKDVLGTELYKWTKLQILNAFGLNQGIFDTDRGSPILGSTKDTALLMALRNAVVPRLREIEDKLNSHLAPDFDERLKVAFDNPVQEDEKTDAAQDVQYIQAGVYNVNEVRQRLGLPPLPEPDNANPLRATVAGSTQLAAMQMAVNAGQMDRQQALAQARIVYGFTAQEGQLLFPDVPEVKGLHVKCTSPVHPGPCAEGGSQESSQDTSQGEPHEAEDEEIDRRQEAEQDALAAQREEAEDVLSDKHDKEVRLLEKQQGKETRSLDRKHEKEDDNTDRARSKEDDNVERQREREYLKRDKDRDWANATPEQAAAWEAEEDHITETVYDVQDAERAKAREEDDDRRLAKHVREAQALEAQQVQQVAALEARHGEESQSLADEWDKHEDDLAGKHRAEDDAVGERRAKA